MCLHFNFMGSAVYRFECDDSTAGNIDGVGYAFIKEIRADEIRGCSSLERCGW
jgi:hypothetical protein